MMMVKSKLKRSPIHGIGVFATQFIPKGTLIWQFDDKFCVNISRKDLPHIHPTMRKHIDIYGYPNILNPDLISLDADNGRFMNHADSPNARFTSPTTACASRDIREGEEITCHYGEFDKSFNGYPADMLATAK